MGSSGEPPTALGDRLIRWARAAAAPETGLYLATGPGLLLLADDPDTREHWLTSALEQLRSHRLPTEVLAARAGDRAYGPFRRWLDHGPPGPAPALEGGATACLTDPDRAAPGYVGAGDDSLQALRLAGFERALAAVGQLEEGTVLVVPEAHLLDADALELLACLLVASAQARLGDPPAATPLPSPGCRPILIAAAPTLLPRLTRLPALASLLQEKLVAVFPEDSADSLRWGGTAEEVIPAEDLEALIRLGALRSARARITSRLAGLPEGESGQLLVLKGRLDLELADPEEATSAFERALSSTRDPELFGLGCLGLWRAFLQRRREDDAAMVLEQGLATARAQGPLKGWLRTLRAELFLEAFELDAAAGALKLAFREAPDGDPLLRARIRLARAQLALEQGDEARPARELESAFAQARASGSHQLLAQVESARGVFLRTRGRFDAALDSYRQALDRLAGRGFHRQLADTLESRARALGQRGRPGEQQRAIDDLRAAAALRDRLGDSRGLRGLLTRLREAAGASDQAAGRAHRRRLARYSGRLHALELVRLGGAAYLPPGRPEALARGLAAAELPTELRNLYAIWELSKSVHHQPDLSRILPLILDGALRLVGGERGFILLRPHHQWDEPPTAELQFADLEFEIARNLEQGEIERPQACISTSIALEVVRSGRSVLTENAALDQRFGSAVSVSEQDLKSVLCAPLRLGRRILGALYLDHPSQSKAFQPGDLRLIEALTGHAAVAIENARLRQLSEEQRHRLERQAASLELKLTQDQSEPAPVASPVAPAPEHDYPEIVGRSQPMTRILRMVDRVADSRIPILIQGESGTGKELIARAVHFHSGRREGPFVTESCAAVTDQILEAELFGYVAGAFTGATEDRQGMFERAHRGTLFLDEIGEMSPKMQGELLRVLEEGEVRRVGGHEVIPVDVRLLSATNRDLQQMVEEKTFRRDLYYRVKVFGLELPPLRERKDDLPLLVEHFLSLIAERGGGRRTIHPDAMKVLAGHHWPGNIRELRNVIERAVTLAPSTEIGPADLAPLGSHPAELRDSDYFRLQMADAKDKFVRDYLEKKLEEHDGHVTRAAEAAGLLRQSLHRLLRRYDIDPSAFRPR